VSECAKVSQKRATKRNQKFRTQKETSTRGIHSGVYQAPLPRLDSSPRAACSPSQVRPDTLPTNFLHALSGTFSTHIHPVANTADQSAQCVKSCKISCSCCEWPVVPRPRDLVFQVWSEPRSRMRCINRTLYMICRLKFLVAASCTEIRAVWMLRRNMGDVLWIRRCGSRKSCRFGCAFALALAGAMR
jgi:hypothetical protein